MKKFAFGFACVLAGCAAGAAMPHVTAQTFAPSPTAQRWQQMCEAIGGMNTPNANARGGTDLVAARGAEGWELATYSDRVF